MNRPGFKKYTADQQKAIAILEEKPLNREQLLQHFPGLNYYQLSVILRTPRETGKVFINCEGKFEVFTAPPNLSVIQGKSQDYTAPAKATFPYVPTSFPKEKH